MNGTRLTLLSTLLLAALLSVSATPRAAQETARQAADRLIKEAERLRATGGDAALPLFKEALPFLQAEKDQAGEAAALYNIGTILRGLGQNRPALESFEKALPLQKSLNKHSSVVDTLGHIGDLHRIFGDLEKSEASYREGIDLAVREPYRRGEGRTLNRLGLLLTLTGRYQEATDAFDRSALIARELREPFDEAATLVNAGLPQRRLGDNQKALESSRRAQSLFHDIAEGESAQKNRARTGEATALANIGLVWGELGDTDAALEWYEKARSLFQAEKNRQQEAVTLNNMGSLVLRLGDRRRASELFNQALQIAREVGDRSNEGHALHNLADVEDDLTRALDLAMQAQSILRAAGDLKSEAVATIQSGRIRYRLGNREEAARDFDRALDQMIAFRDTAGEASARAGLARLHRDAGRLDSAREQQETVLERLESVRGSVAINELRSTYMASTQGEYEFYRDLLMQLHERNPSAGFDALAFQTSERARARSLIELLAESRADIRKGVPPALLERERSQRHRLEAAASRYAGASATNRGPIAELLRVLTDGLKEIEGQIRTASPEYAALLQPRPISLQEVQARILDPDTALLEYSLGDERSYVWVVTKTSFNVYSLRSRAVIEKAAGSVYRLTSVQPIGQAGRSAQERLSREAAELSDMLLGKVMAEIKGKRLLIVADGALQSLPFAALPIPGRGNSSGTRPPLNAEHEVVYMQSASALAVLRQQLGGRAPAPRDIAVYADPVFTADDERVPPVARNQGSSPQGFANAELLRLAARKTGISNTRERIARLPYSITEANAILSIFPAGKSKRAMGFEASRHALISPESSQYKIIHIASHGLVDNKNPQLSGIILSLVDGKGAPVDGYIRLQDLYNMDLPAELVVLSACQTALGEDIRGEGLVGLTRGFMYAGAARVIASLWKVDDAATAELMKRFYKQMMGTKRLAPAAALRAAQAEMAKDPEWRAPYYWAGFVLQGEWKGW